MKFQLYFNKNKIRKKEKNLGVLSIKMVEQQTPNIFISIIVMRELSKIARINFFHHSQN